MVILPADSRRTASIFKEQFMDSEPIATNDTLPTPSHGNASSQLASIEDEVIIRAVKLNKYFGDKHVLKDIDFEVRKREVVALIGPSGSGKSTLIRCLNGLRRLRAVKSTFTGSASIRISPSSNLVLFVVKLGWSSRTSISSPI